MDTLSVTRRRKSKQIKLEIQPTLKIRSTRFGKNKRNNRFRGGIFNKAPYGIIKGTKKKKRKKYIPKGTFSKEYYLKKQKVKNFIKNGFYNDSNIHRGDKPLSLLSRNRSPFTDTNSNFLFKEQKVTRLHSKSIFHRKNFHIYRLRLKWVFFISTRKLAKIYSKKREMQIDYLTRRLDYFVHNNICHTTVLHARQLVVHGHFVVNGQRCFDPGKVLKYGDIVQFYRKSNLTSGAIHFKSVFLDMIETILKNNLVKWVKSVTRSYRRLGYQIERKKLVPLVFSMYVNIGSLIGINSIKRRIYLKRRRGYSGTVYPKGTYFNRLRKKTSSILDYHTFSFIVSGHSNTNRARKVSFLT